MTRVEVYATAIAGFCAQLLAAATTPAVTHAQSTASKKGSSADICTPLDVPFSFLPTALGVDPFHRHALMAAGDRELYATHSGGQSWTRINTPWADAIEWDIAYDPKRRDVVYVAVDNALYRSLDGGKRFSLLAEFPRTNTTRIVIAPSDPRVIYLWALHTFPVGDTFSTLPFIYKSSDSGATWTTLDIDDAVDIAVSPQAADVLYVVDVNGALSKTSDGGATFDPLPADFITTQSTQHTIEVAPQDGQIIYASIGSGIIRSTDGGASWEQRSDVPGNVLAVDPQRADTLYLLSSAGEFSSALFRSEDAGATRVQVSSASAPSLLEFDTRSGDEFYLSADTLYRCDGSTPNSR